MEKKEEYETIEEKVKFLTLGKLKSGQNSDTSFVLKEGQTVEGIVTEVKDSEIYKKVYTLKVEGEDCPIVVTGKRDLNEKLGFGKMSITPVKTGDKLSITWTGTYKAKNGTGFKFEVGIKRS